MTSVPTNPTEITAAGGAHIGAVTHHQLHAATHPAPVNFNVRKTTKITPSIPTPRFVLFFSFTTTSSAYLFF